MEEILASIRQIISEDGEGVDDASAGQAAASVAADAKKDDSGAVANDDQDTDARTEADLAKAEDSFSSDDEAADDDGGAADEAAMSYDDAGAGEGESEAFEDPDETAADVFSSKPDTESDVEESISMAMPAESKNQSPAPIGDDNLLSDDSHEVVHGAFSALAHTILAQNARTLEDLVSEMLQPMLKGWLDDNLPPLVERLVKEEIDRVSRGRR